MAVDMKKLKNKMAQNNYTNDTLAKKIGMDQSTLYRKLKNNGDTFLIREVYAMMDALLLDEFELTDIFFCKNSHLR